MLDGTNSGIVDDIPQRNRLVGLESTRARRTSKPTATSSGNATRRTPPRRKEAYSTSFKVTSLLKTDSAVRPKLVLLNGRGLKEYALESP